MIKKTLAFLAGVAKYNERDMLRDIADSSTAKAAGISGNPIPGMATQIKNALVRRPGGTETFDQAVTRLRLTDADINNREVAFERMSLTWAALAGITLAWGVAQWSVLATSLSMLLAVICGLQWFYHNMRLWQVRNRTLCSAGEFMAQPGWHVEWLR